MRKIVNRKENAVKRAVVLFRALMIPALLLGWQGTAMNVQAAEEAPETQEEAQAAVPVEETQALEQPDAAEAAVPPEIGTENADAEVIASAGAGVGASRARMEREIFCFSSSTAVILASTVWPSLSSSPGFSMR